MQHEQDAVEGGLIAHCELACATFGGGSEGGDQGLQLQPQFFANGLSCHEGMKHNCFMRVSWAVVLATLIAQLANGWGSGDLSVISRRVACCGSVSFTD